MHLNGETYEYIAIYVDDLLIAAKDPLSITKCLEDKHSFKLEGIGLLEYPLWDVTTSQMILVPYVLVHKTMLTR
jgi:hypothetical protein